MSDLVKYRIWENAVLETNIFYFFAKEIALILDFTNPQEATRNHIDPEDLITLKDLLGDDKDLFE